jgi:hypothetical protein
MSRFERICIQSLEKVLIRAKKFKNSKWVSKTAEFHADFKSVEKGLRKYPKELVSKNVTEICNFTIVFFFVKLVCL